jgi:hypothetical protein
LALLLPALDGSGWQSVPSQMQHAPNGFAPASVDCQTPDPLDSAPTDNLCCSVTIGLEAQEGHGYCSLVVLRSIAVFNRFTGNEMLIQLKHRTTVMRRMTIK